MYFLKSDNKMDGQYNFSNAKREKEMFFFNIKDYTSLDFPHSGMIELFKLSS